MTDDDPSVSGIRQSLDMALDELGRAQAGLSAVQDRVDAVKSVVTRVMTGSGKDSAASALSGLEAMKTSSDETLAASFLVKEQILTFVATL
jgi:hypothetical protein